MWPFTKKPSTAPKGPTLLSFKNGQSFLEYQCRFGHTEIRPNETIVGLVLDASKEYGTDTTVSVRSDGVQTAMLRIASSDGGFIVPARTASGSGSRLKPDDVVLWVPKLKGVPFLSDERSAWTGVIVAIVAPEINIRSPEFRILCRYA